MRLYPHLHLLLPSSSHGKTLETRIYLPPNAVIRDPNNDPVQFTTDPSPWLCSEISSEIIDYMKSYKVSRLITAAHPWGKLGGNMLDPVLARSLVEAIQKDDSQRTALVTYNARGVGRSEGSFGLFRLGATADENNDFDSLERLFVNIFNPAEVRRVGYSWGCLAAIYGPKTSPVHSTLLVSPATSLFYYTTFFNSPSFSTALRQAGKVRVIHGTQDQFTSASNFGALQADKVECLVVEGADHFYRDEHSSNLLQQGMLEWLREA